VFKTHVTPRTYVCVCVCVCEFVCTTSAWCSACRSKFFRSRHQEIRREETRYSGHRTSETAQPRPSHRGTTNNLVIPAYSTTTGVVCPLISVYSAAATITTTIYAASDRARRTPHVFARRNATSRSAGVQQQHY